MVDRTDSFLREVNEEVRRERLLQIWRRYGTLIVAAIVAAFVGVGAYLWWSSSQKAAQEKAGAEYIAASRLATEGKTDEALKAFAELEKSAPGSYQALASLRIAGEQATAGRIPDALKAYEAVAQQSDTDELLRDFAALQAAMLRLDQADWTEMKNRLTPLTEESKPWHPLAREVLGYAAYKAGQYSEATKLFEQNLGDRDSATGLSQRAQEMLALLTDAAGAKPEKPESSDKPAEGKGGDAKTTPK